MKNTEQTLDYAREVRHYLTGFGWCLALTLVPFALVAWGGLSLRRVLSIIALLAIVQIVVQFRYFLHIDLSRQKREDLLLILFSLLLLVIMVGGTVWVMMNLSMRMM